MNPEEGEEKIASMELKYKETNRKTIAFYFTMLLCTGLFIWGSKQGYDTKDIVEALSSLGLAYVIGISALDATRAYRIDRRKRLDDEFSPVNVEERYKDR